MVSVKVHEMIYKVSVFLLLVCKYQIALVVAEPPSFTIDYNRNTFMKDGQPFRYNSYYVGCKVAKVQVTQWLEYR